MRFSTLKGWLDWQQQLHPQSIELGLERVSKVWDQLNLGRIAHNIIIVAGTNGKGSTVAMYQHWLANAGYRVASFTSPHLLKYNERIKLGNQPVLDEPLCQAFAEIDQARGDISLSYFEFSTLAALVLMAKYQPDFAILEVGLGGRLDSVNIIDADLAHITRIGLDHQDYLGDTREQIALEKAGILRASGLAICHDPQPPSSLLQRFSELACKASCLGRDFHVSETNHSKRFVWQQGTLRLQLETALPGWHQIQNQAGVLAGLNQLLDLSGFSEAEINQNFSGLTLAGRFQTISSSIPATTIVDVGHNPDAAQMLARNIQSVKSATGKVILLLGMLSDKDSQGFVEPLRAEIDECWLIDLKVDRGLSAEELASRLADQLIEVPHRCFNSMEQIWHHAVPSLGNQDIMLVTGSFFTVECLLQHLSTS